MSSFTMSLPAEQLHQQSLDILAKLASLHKSDNVEGILNEANRLVMNTNKNNTNMCPLCGQINCDRNCDKENIVKVSIEKQKGLKTPQKPVSVSEPITPTANLKMLVSAASGLEPAVRKEDNDAVVYDADGEYAEDVADQKAKVKKGELMGRKEKSLGLLCKKFMSIYPEFSPHGTTIMLDDVVTSLGIGRRRVYDIVNVLESMEMMVRQAKNKYIWFGKSRLPETLAKLKALALRVYGANFCHIVKQVCHTTARQKPKEAVKKMCYILPNDFSIQPGMKILAPADENSATPLLNNSNGNNNVNVNNYNDTISNDENTTDCGTDANGETLYQQIKFAGTDHDTEVNDFTHLMMDSIISYDLGRRDGNRSLGILCQKFIMLFMVAEENIVSLDRAAKLLITDPEEGPGKYKTKVRRLYDIANILSSINFLEKCVSYEERSKKAAYKWIGLDLKSINCEETASKAFLSQEFSLTRHSLLTQAPRECYKLFNNGDKSLLRKFRFRSSSAHNLSTNQQSTNQQSTTACNPKQIRSFCLRTLSDTMVNNGEHTNMRKDDGFNIENFEEDAEMNTVITTGTSNKVPAPQDESPNQVLFKEKLRNLQKEFPDKLHGESLLDLLSGGGKEISSPVPSRRRLSSELDAQVVEPFVKKIRTERSEGLNYSSLFESQFVVNNIPSPVSVTKSPVPLSLFTAKAGNTVLRSCENIPRNGVKPGGLQPPTFLTIPAMVKPVVNGRDSPSSMQNISTMLLSPISNPLSLPKSGLYQIIPVQCHPFVERIDPFPSPGNKGTLIARQSPKSTSEAPKMAERPNAPIIMRPPVATVTSPSVAISPTPASLKSFTDSPINYQQLNENYHGFFTPPHVLHQHSIKPPANPITFPKMTPETPTSFGLSRSVLTNVTRKLSLQRENTI